MDHITEPAWRTPNGPHNATHHAILCPRLSLDFKVVLVTADGLAAPVGFATLAALAASIHRRRGDDALQLTPERLRFRDEVREAIRVTATHPVSGEVRLIGHAWIDGRPWRALADALEAHTPSRAVRLGDERRGAA